MSAEQMAPEAGEASQLRRLLHAAGYRLTDTEHGLLAWRFEDRRAVLLVSSERDLATAARELPSDAAHRTILCVGELTEESRSTAAELGVELLRPDTLGPALGELLLLPPGGAPLTPIHPSTPLEPPVAVLPTGQTIVRPRLTREDAERIAGGPSSRFTLRLLPYFVAPYRVRLPPSAGGSPSIREDLVAVNGLSGVSSVWGAGQRELVAEIPSPFQKLQAVLTEAAARAQAEEYLRHHYTVGVDRTEQHEGALVIERRRVAPPPEDLRIGPFALLQFPFWYVEGADGRVVIDAVTGNRIAGEIG
jgi:hypothetical protein